MAQLIKLNVTKRTPSPGNSRVISPAALYGFDIEDIVVPIRRNAANTASYFTARQMKGSASGASENAGKTDYEVSDVLTSVAGQSSDIVLLSVISRTVREVPLSNEKHVFVKSRISENIEEVVDTFGFFVGSKFFYNEDGDPLPVQYIVAETIDTIVGASVPGGGGTITEINYNLALGTNIDLAPYSGEMIINVNDGANPTGILNSFSNHTNVTKVTIRAKTSLDITVNDGDPSLKLATAAVTLFGPKFGFLELTKRNSKFFQTNLIDQYN